MLLASAFGVVAQLAAVALATITWQVLLRAAGVKHPWRDCFRAIGGSAVAKYVPGNVFHLVGRAAVAARDGVPTGAIVGTMAIEAMLVLFSAALVGSPAIAARLDELFALVPGPGPLAGLGIAAFFVLAAVVLFAGRSLQRREARTSLSAVGITIALDVATFILLGLSMAATLGAVLEGTGVDGSTVDAIGVVVACVPAFAVAWALGFVVPGAPGGIGVREATFLLLLPLQGDVVQAAVIVALVLGRLQSVVADVLVFGLARAMPTTAAATATR